MATARIHRRRAVSITQRLHDRFDRPDQRRHEPVGVGDGRIVHAVDAERLGVGDQLEQLHLASQRHDLVAHREHVRHGHVDLASHSVDEKLPMALAGLEHHPPVVGGRLLDRPRLPLLVLRCR